uniref:Family with sequence similarity 60, member A, like n=1 Tax=Nothobranchius rachovii TaxID=451742 RepID=A0A1A8QM73_9TELE
MDKYRKRSVVWSYFKDIDASSVQCLLCSRHLRRKDHGSTTPMLRHLRLKHSAQITLDAEGGGGQMSQSVELDSDQTFSVVVELEKEDSHIIPQTLNDSQVHPDVGSNLEAAEEAPAEKLAHREASVNSSLGNTRRRSLIWRLFEHLESLKAARCRICMKKLHESGGISNLRRHLMKRHPKVLSELLASSHHHPAALLKQPDLSVTRGAFLETEDEEEPVKVILVDGNSEIIGELTQAENPTINGLLQTLGEDSAQKTTNTEASEATCATGEISWDNNLKWVTVATQDGGSDVTTPSNEADCSPATNGQLDTLQEGSTQQTTNSDKSTDQAVKSTRRRSLIWKHFVRLESLEAAQCRICLKKLQCFESGCTSNLHRHMLKRHPKVCIKTKSSQQLHPSQHSDANNETSVDSSVTRHEQTSDGLKVAVESEVEGRVFMRERELIEALRRTQREESRTLEHQRELLEKLRSASAREALADREKIEALRKAQQEEADELRRQREELEKEKAELQRKWDELNQERVELLLLSRDKKDS